MHDNEPLKILLSRREAASTFAVPMRKGMLQALMSTRDYARIKRLLGLPRNAQVILAPHGAVRLGELLVAPSGEYTRVPSWASVEWSIFIDEWLEKRPPA